MTYATRQSGDSGAILVPDFVIDLEFTLIALFDIDTPNYWRSVTFSTHDHWPLRSVTRTVAQSSGAAGPPSAMTGKDSVRPATQAVLVS